jgi:hypothetical protein
MFKENTDHKQQEIYNSSMELHPKIQEKLKESWASIFYEHVFCKIDEKPFAALYSPNKGRSNFPVNTLLSLELIKHLFDYTDETLLDQYNFNYQVMYALGERNLGERHLAERTFYNFRRRVYQYTTLHPEKENLIFGQFKALTRHFIERAGINTQQQRMDSTFFMSNIKLAGRLSLAYDVLLQAIKACPEEILPDKLKEVLDPEFKTNLLFRNRSSQLPGQLEEMLNLAAMLLGLVKGYKIASSFEILLVERFLEEQALYDKETKSWHPKKNKEIKAASLQSAYDPDATFRKKGDKANKGYLLNLTETCADENPVQLLTDYNVKNSSASDTEMLAGRLQEIKSNTDITDLYVDGGYYGKETEIKAQEHQVKMHYTDMTGTAPRVNKILLTAFEIDGDFKVLSCPEKHPALKSNLKKKTGIVSAHFSLEHCRQCPQRENCPVRFQKKSAVLRVKQNAILAARARERVFCEPLRKEATSKRAAVEGSISAIKRSQGAGKLRVRTYPKVQVAMGLKLIGHNIRQMIRFYQGKVRKAAGVVASVKKACVSPDAVIEPGLTGAVCTF